MQNAIDINAEKYFFILLRVALGKEERLPEAIGEDVWRRIFDIARKHTLLGFSYTGVERLPAEQRPPKDIIMSWFAATKRIEQLNRKSDRQSADVATKFSSEGFDCCILKGQGIAQLYTQPLRRTPGDVDVWLKGDKKDIIRYVRGIIPGCEPVYHHVDFPVSDDVDIEVHFTPSWMNCYRLNRRLQRFFNERIDKEMANSVTTGDGVVLPVPTLAFNRVYILLHIYRHLFSEGIGLRQLLDYYMVLMQGFTAEEKAETLAMLRSLRMIGFAKAMMYVLQEVFALPEDNMPVAPDAEQGAFLLQEIMESGNFGRYGKMYAKLQSGNIFVRSRYSLMRNLRFLRYYPSEVLWSPLFKTWHYFWRKSV